MQLKVKSHNERGLWCLPSSPIINLVYTLMNCFAVVFPQVFERILFIWAIRHPASGYVQGINDLVTPFFVVFLSEFVSKLLVGMFLHRALFYSHWSKITLIGLCLWFTLFGFLCAVIWSGYHCVSILSSCPPPSSLITACISLMVYL